AHEEKATASIKETADTITSLQSELASLKAKGSLDANKEIREDHTLVHELEKQVNSIFSIVHSNGMTLLLRSVTVPPATMNFSIPWAVDGTARILLTYSLVVGRW
ncbi:hypothetical protein Tco_1158844, partial [Tanacetum coccineum]